MVEIIESRFGKTHTQYLIDSGTIELLPLHKVTGRSFNNAWVCVDECQGMNTATMYSLITRMGKYSKLVFMGDIRQKLLNKDSGIRTLLDLCDKYDMQFNIVEFTLEDCVRSEKVKSRIQHLMSAGVY
jgi:phosphate starvation-inducible protein PhoH